MNGARDRILALAAMLVASPALADPSVNVTYDGVNDSGNNTWTAWVSPDPNLFSDTSSGFGSSMAVELAFAVRGSSFVSYERHTSNWDYENPGFNPFLDGEITDQTWLSPDQTELFGAYGSPVFTEARAYELLYFETLGSDRTTLDYGVAASGDPVMGATIAQRGRLFTTENVVALVAEASAPLSTPIVAQLLSPPAGVARSGGASEIETHFFTGITGSVSSIPEPTAILLLTSGLLAWPALGRR